MKAGSRVIVTTGEYSDYGIRDSFVVLKDFSFDVALENWMSTHGDEGNFGYGEGRSEHDFLKSLRLSGYVADEPLNEVHLCDYCRPNMFAAGDAADEPGTGETP